MHSRKNTIFIALIFLLVLLAASLATAYKGDGIVEPGENQADELRRAAQNPMAETIPGQCLLAADSVECSESANCP